MVKSNARGAGAVCGPRQRRIVTVRLRPADVIPECGISAATREEAWLAAIRVGSLLLKLGWGRSSSAKAGCHLCAVVNEGTAML